MPAKRGTQRSVLEVVRGGGCSMHVHAPKPARAQPFNAFNI